MVDYPQREWEPELTIEEKTNTTTNGKGEKNGHFKNRCDITLDCLPSMVTYSYDGAGNRLTMSDDWQTTSYSYNAANQMVQAGTAIFSYDANGKHGMGSGLESCIRMATPPPFSMMASTSSRR